MKPVIFLAALILIAIKTPGQLLVPTNEFPPGVSVFVFSPAGLTLRTTPDVKGEAIEIIPFGSSVEVLKDPAQPVIFTSGNITGNWLKVKFGEHEGFAFDGYLSRLPTNNDKLRIEDYLRTVFETKSTVTTTSDKSVKEYEKTIFTNGVVYELRTYEGGSTSSVSFPLGLVSLTELYLLARISFPIYFSSRRSCSISSDHIACHSGEMSTLKIDKIDNNFILVEEAAD